MDPNHTISASEDDDSNTIDNASLDSEKVQSYGDALNTEQEHQNLTPHRSISRILHSINSRESEDKEDREELKKLISNNKGVERIISELEEGTGRLGPLEQPYDLKRITTQADPNSDFNEADPWKYPLDSESGLRIVEFVPNDEKNPKNLSITTKWVYTGVLGFMCFVVALGSAIVTGDLERPAEYFGVSQEVIILASVTVFVIGFGVGPLLFAPMSEEVGRKPIYATTLAIAVVFIVPCGAAKNIGTLLVCRLIDGIAFSAPMTLIGCLLYTSRCV